MSTKIYPALRMAKDRFLQSFFAFTDEIKSEYVPLLYRRYAQDCIFNQRLRVITNSQPLSVMDYLANKEQKHKMDIVAIPRDEFVYMILYGKDSDIAYQVLASYGAEDYEYYNSTDRPDNVSYSEWEQRRIRWDSIFEETNIPVNVGIVISIDHVISYSRLVKEVFRLKKKKLSKSDILRLAMALILITPPNNVERLHREGLYASMLDEATKFYRKHQRSFDDYIMHKLNGG